MNKEGAADGLWPSGSNPKSAASEIIKGDVENMKKKLISILSAVTLIMTALPSAMAENSEGETAPETVLYENDFNAGTLETAFASYENDYLSLAGYSATGVKEYEGAAIGYSDGALVTGANRGVDGRTILFDFTKGGTQDGISSGKLVIGYDMTLRTTSDAYAATYVGMNMKNYWDGGRMVYFAYNGYDARAIINDWPENEAQTLVTDGKAHRYETLFDFADGKAYLYMDGVMVHIWTNLYGAYATMNNYSIAINGDVSRFDNLKVALLNDASTYSFITNDGTNANGYVEVVFPTAMDTEEGTFVIDGSPAEKVEWASLSVARVYSENLKNLGEHTVIVQGAADLYGVAPQNTQAKVNISAWDKEYILYEATFDNGAADLYWEADNDFFTGGYNSNKINENAEYPVGGKKAASFSNGANLGIGYEPTWWAKGQTFWFDFTKGGTKSAPTSGTLKFSMDFMLQEAPTENEGSSFIKNGSNSAPTSSWSFAGFIYKDGKPYMITYDASGSGYIIHTDLDRYGDELDYEMHTLDMYISFGAEGRVTTYLDGVQMPRVFNYWTTINQFGFAMSGVMKYIDNVKLSYVKDGSFGVDGLKTPVAGDNTLTLYTTEQAVALTPENVTVTKNGTAVTPSDVTVKTIPSSIDNNTRYAVEITLPEAVTEGAEYEATLGSTVTSVKGYAVNASVNSAKATAKAKAETVTGITVANDKATAIIVNDGEEAIKPIMIVADYNSEGRMTSAKTVAAYDVDGYGATEIPVGKTATITYDMSGMTANAKVMLIKDYASLTPIVQAK